MKDKEIINKDSELFLEKYINNPSPTGFEKDGQKLWLDYINPYVDDYFTDNYGNAVAVINPEKKYKVVIEAQMRFHGLFITLIQMDLFI